ncbi:hypothetical protein IC582_023605 [Cucumis melo]
MYCISYFEIKHLSFSIEKNYPQIFISFLSPYHDLFPFLFPSPQNFPIVSSKLQPYLPPSHIKRLQLCP